MSNEAIMPKLAKLLNLGDQRGIAQSQGDTIDWLIANRAALSLANEIEADCAAATQRAETAKSETDKAETDLSNARWRLGLAREALAKEGYADASVELHQLIDRMGGDLAALRERHAAAIAALEHAKAHTGWCGIAGDCLGRHSRPRVSPKDMCAACRIEDALDSDTRAALAAPPAAQQTDSNAAPLSAKD